MYIKKFSALVVAATLLSPLSAEAARKMSFVMAHKPENIENVKLIENFANKVRERTNGEIDISLFMPPESADFQRALDEVYLGKSEFSQIATKHFLPVSQDLDVLDMPMLFETHEHATKVLDGDVGAALRDGVYRDSNGRLKGLSFTYSGGFRHVYSTKDIDSVAELKGQKMRLRGGRFSLDAMDQLGLDYVYTAPGDYTGWADMHLTGEIEAEEAETNRIATYKYRHPEMSKTIKTVLETNHSLYLTMVVMNGEAFTSLTPMQQKVVQEEAQNLAVAERDLSIRQEQESKKQMMSEGVKFVTMDAEDKAILAAMGQRIHEKYRPTMGRWIDAIKAAAPQGKVKESKVKGTAAKPL